MSYGGMDVLSPAILLVWEVKRGCKRSGTAWHHERTGGLDDRFINAQIFAYGVQEIFYCAVEAAQSRCN